MLEVSFTILLVILANKKLDWIIFKVSSIDLILLSFIYVFTANVTLGITSRWHVTYGQLRYEGRVFCITGPSVLH